MSMVELVEEEMKKRGEIQTEEFRKRIKAKPRDIVYRVYYSGFHGYEKIGESKDLSKIKENLKSVNPKYYEKYLIIEQDNTNNCDFPILAGYFKNLFKQNQKDSLDIYYGD